MGAELENNSKTRYFRSSLVLCVSLLESAGRAILLSREMARKTSVLL